MKKWKPPVEIRCPEGPGVIDEIVAKNVGILHVEQMSDDGWFMGLDMQDGSYWQFWFGSKNRKAHVEFRHTETVSPEENRRLMSASRRARRAQ